MEETTSNIVKSTMMQITQGITGIAAQDKKEFNVVSWEYCRN